MDFENILQAQRNYLDNLSSQYGTGEPAIIGRELNAINTNLKSLQDDLTNENTNNIITRQADMNRIVGAETTRLQTKQGSIDQATASQQRLIDLNQSYSEKFNQYIYIIIIFVVALVLFLGIRLIQQNMVNTSSGLFMFLQIIVLCGAFIYAIIIYNNIQARSNMNYAELNLSIPPPLTPAEIASQNAKSVDAGKLLASQNVSNCTGSTCCGATTQWDASMQACVTDRSGFTTIADSGNIILGNYNKKASDTMAYSDNEFDVYALYR